MNLTDTVQTVLKTKPEAIYMIASDATVYDALQIMSDREVGSLLVLADNGELEGIVSERDYARKVILQGKSSKDTTVREIMGSASLSVTTLHSIDECMRMMTAHRVRHLPVVDGTRICGVISMGDLVNYIISAQEEEIAHLHAYVAGAYPR
jgi:CBS domain-containing protein